MSVTLAILLMVLAALALALLPLLRRPRTDDRSARDLAVFRRQLRELEIERAAGLIGEREAEAARIEIERRALAAADRTERDDARPLPPTLSVALVGLAVLAAIPVYLLLGRPDLESRSAPAVGEPAPADGERSMRDIVDDLARRMEADPERLDGWRLLGRSALAIGRPQLAADAFARAIELAPDDAELHAGFGEALFALADGNMTPAVRLAFTRALERDPDNPAARFYAGLAHARDGDRERAAAIWRDMLARAPEDAPWRAGVVQQLARLEPQEREGRPPALDSETLARAADMSPEEREAMIRGMVDRLAARLDAQPDDYRGWLELARARIILEDDDGAKEALLRARETAPADLREAIDRQLQSFED